MSETTTEFLTRFFVECLPFTPTARQIDIFQSDLSLVSPYLMEASLREVVAGKRGKAIKDRPTEWRQQIFAVYNRKVAEHAQLFPIFHTFETAVRSTVAVGLEDYYQHKRWWRGIYDQIRKGRDPNEITQISGVELTKEANKVIARICYAVDGEDLRFRKIEAAENGFEFCELCDLAHLRQLIEKHWKTVFIARLGTSKGKPAGLSHFITKFDRIREARNDVYHHKSVSGTSDVVAHAEELLDRLNCSLSFISSKIAESKLSELRFDLPIQARHNTW